MSDRSQQIILKGQPVSMFKFRHRGMEYIKDKVIYDEITIQSFHDPKPKGLISLDVEFIFSSSYYGKASFLKASVFDLAVYVSNLAKENGLFSSNMVRTINCRKSIGPLHSEKTIIVIKELEDKIPKNVD